MALVISMKKHLETLLENIRVYHLWITEASTIGKWLFRKFTDTNFGIIFEARQCIKIISLFRMPDVIYQLLGTTRG